MLPNTIMYENDEVFYSWIMHIFMYNYAAESYPRAFKEWMNPERYDDSRHVPRACYDFKENLYYWMKNVGWSLQDAMSYFMKTSLYPIMSPFMKPHQRNLYILLAFGKLTMPQIDTLNTILTTITTRLKLCPECAKEELQDKGIFWYHRAHQIPGVTACYKHGCRLNNGPQKRFHELNIDEIDLTDIQTATKGEQEYALFTYEYLHDPESCMYDYMHEFIMDKIKEKFPLDTGNLFEKYTKEIGYYSLFGMKPSYFILRKDEEGTFFDPQNDLVALFVLYKNFQRFKNDANIISKQENYSIQTCKLMNVIKKYVEKYEKINQSDVSAENPRSKELFMEEINTITGDEYRLIGDYENSAKKVTLLHTKCNHIFEMKPINFLAGKRCMYCKQVTYTDDFGKYVETATNGRYIIPGHATNNLYIVHDSETLLDYRLEKTKILQEINRKDGSLYFENINTNADDLATTSNKIYVYIRKMILPQEPIFLEDIREYDQEHQDYTIKRSFTNLCKKDLIVKCYPGVYRFPEDQFSDLELLEARYVKRGEKIIGCYYGNSLASMILGLKPIDNVTRYIMTNKEAGIHGRNKVVFGIKIRIKGCKCEITKENYIVLQTLDFLLNYWKYTDADCEKVISSVTQYWISNQIPVSLIIQYQKIYDWKQNKSCERAIEVLKCEYQKKESRKKNVD